MRLSNYLRMDNGAYFIGDLLYSRHFSRIARLCLYFGVEPVWATIDTKQEQMMIYYREKKAEEAELIKIYEYMITENVKNSKRSSE